MAQFPLLKLELREKTGSNACRTTRQRSGYSIVPGIIYGESREPVAIQASEKELSAVIRANAHIIMVDAGKGERPALFKEVQYDTYGDRIMHFDLQRVSENSRVHVPVPIIFKHEEDCAGVREGGQIERLAQVVELDCPVTGVPHEIELDLTELELGKHFTFSDLTLPENVQLYSDAHKNVVVCHTPKAAPVEGEAAAAPAP